MMAERPDNSNRKNVIDSLDFMTFLQQQKSVDSMNAPASGSQGQDRKNMLDSVDFVNFLQQKSMKSTDSLSGILAPGSALFKSKDSFANALLSRDWASGPVTPRGISASGDGKPSAGVQNFNIPTAFTAAPPARSPRDGKFVVEKSQDWIKFNTLGEYVDIPVSTTMFSSTGGSKQQSKPSPAIPTSFVKEAPMQQPAEAASVPKKKKKRKRAPRKKIVPQNKQYLEYGEHDVLMGRGGKSNHHPGNLKYRQEIERLQEGYKNTDDKDEKTRISEQLVARVQSYGGNFLEKDERGWYIIDDVVARRKVSQALREDKDPEKRRAKRQRFLEKRAKLEEQGRNK
mmetsp:Transcript_11149/g.23083  ORF Transcript_11149/g.23083 Transcript_11149/m.23083 type:complete len:342 (+) Transcript_11149:222-1247(+)